MFSYNTNVRYSEVDCNKKMTIPAIINYLQDTCVFHSEEVGAGLDYVEKVERVWMLGAWRIEFLKDIDFLDEIKLSTWPYAFKAFMGYRNLTIERNGEMCVRADSAWMLYSIKDKRLVKAQEADIEYYPCEPALEMEKVNRKLNAPDNMGKKQSIVVTNSFIDTNGHVNNGKYIQIAIDAIDNVNFGSRISVLEAEYKKQAMLNDIIIPYTAVSEREVFVSLKAEDDSVFANIKFTF